MTSSERAENLMNRPTVAAEANLSSSAPPAAAPRLRSLDALRGFDMFWIVGGEAVLSALHNLAPNRVTNFLITEFSHQQWEGFHFYDLIFPLFVFIAGVSMTFSLDKAVARHGRSGAWLGLGRRCGLLVLLGLLYYGGLSHHWPDIRLTGVLQLIGVSSFLAGSIYVLSRRDPRVLMAAALAVMLGYWALMALVPFPGIHLSKESLSQLAAKVGSNDPSLLAHSVPRVHGVYAEGYNLANYFDYRFLPGRREYGDGTYEAQGPIEMVVATSTCLLGILAGLWLRREGEGEARKAIGLLGAGVASVVLGFALAPVFPVVKKIWSPTFVLVAGGYSATLLGAFYYIVEVRKKTSWCEPFVWIGMNPSTIYLAYNIVNFQGVAERLAGGDLQRCLDTHVGQGAGGVFLDLVEVALMFALVRFLYVRKIFIRL
jgi:predicted acyltransferase